MSTSKSKKRVPAFIFAIFISWVFVCLSGCSPILPREAQNKPTKSQTPLPPLKSPDINILTPQPTPIYIITHHPNQTFSKKLYDQFLTLKEPSRGINLQLKGNKLGLREENVSAYDIAERATLIVDGIKISNDSLVLGDGLVEGYGPYFLSWAPQLAPGLHEATFRLLNDSGETLEFTWQFILTEE
jgi:hypothetical protein